MAQIIPRTQSSLEAFTQAFTPGLERAIQFVAQRRLQEQKDAADAAQRQKDLEAFSEFLKAQGSGVIPSLGPQGVSLRGQAPISPSQQLKQRQLDLQTGLSEAVTFGGGFEELKKRFPTQVENIIQTQQQTTPIQQDPGFQEGLGIPALFSRQKAKITPKTRAVLEQIKTEADFQELLERADEAEKKGIDIAAILEFFGRR